MPILAQVLMVGLFDLIHQQQLPHVKSQHLSPEMSCTDIIGEKGLQSKGRDCMKVLQGKAILKLMVKQESKSGLGSTFVSLDAKAPTLCLPFPRPNAFLSFFPER